MRHPAKHDQRRHHSAAQEEQRGSAEANEKSRNPDLPSGSREARLERQPGVRAEKVNEEESV
jgi:hypothetical protein